jgi:hypothetical protein
MIDPEAIDAWGQVAVGTMQRDGIITAPWAVRYPDMLRVKGFLMPRPVWDTHVKAKSGNAPLQLEVALRTRAWPMMCHSMRDIILAPELFETALQFKPFADAYFGEFARLYSANAFWTQPAPHAPAYPLTHYLHRDDDDRKQLVMFIYGTDVTVPADGAHVYVYGSHVLTHEQESYNETKYGRLRHLPVLGPAGTMFFADTAGFHMGLRPTTKPRLLIWFRWGVSTPPPSYISDKLAPVLLPPEKRGFFSNSALREAVQLVAI